ncbi:hypothetical protein B0A48_02010 [Cryoendolithus antarcticus]|uniref:Uncharacterized protein n=1 Tax=Cryoendolithus antarcticus TaxID=1507870 RepID=A0A1V8TQZ7_9PEZI|nr:hypothetical protein B0A48_02010 [Cryoendolithus antarcticus]
MPQASAFAQLARHQESDGLYTVAASTSEAHGQEPVADPLLIWEAKPSLAHAVAAKNWSADISSNGVPVSQRMPANPLAKKRNEQGNLKYVECKDCVAIFDGGRAAKIMSQSPYAKGFGHDGRSTPLQGALLTQNWCGHAVQIACSSDDLVLGFVQDIDVDITLI